MTYRPPEADHRGRFAAVDLRVPCLDGQQRPYINLDNAASTPPLAAVRQVVDRFLDYYASVHRGTGYKSRLSTEAYETARTRALRFVGADPSAHTCIFAKNTTECVNKLARRLPLSADDVVLVTAMEHHSNDLPFRGRARVVHVGLLPDGRLDEVDFDRQVERAGRRLRLVAVTGASNVTGFINPIHRLAEKAHAAGALILVDCAQLAPHRPIRMGRPGDPSHLDFVAFSAHKLYAPFGSGALVGRREIFETGDPDQPGGGTVEIVTLDEVVWAEPPDREEAGSPNVVGAVALGAATVELQQIGMAAVAEHEARLTAYALERLPSVPRLRLFGESDPERAAERLGVIPFQIEGLSHFLVAAVLGYEYGIGVRSGCFCAHPYVLHLLGLSRAEAGAVRDRMLAGDRSEMPGMVRASFGLYNTAAEVDSLVDALAHIAAGRLQGDYRQDPATGEFSPLGWHPPALEQLPFLD